MRRKIHIREVQLQSFRLSSQVRQPSAAGLREYEYFYIEILPSFGAR